MCGHLQQLLLPAGKILGGTSSINYLIYNRGHPSDYEAWNVDSPGWAYEDVLPYFVRAEQTEISAHKESRKSCCDVGTMLYLVFCKKNYLKH